MKVKNTYAPAPEKTQQRRKLIKIARWPFLSAAYICPIVNIIVGGKPWSIVVLLGLHSIWKLFLSIDLVEYNRLSQAVKGLYFSILMLATIDLCLAPGWALDVIPIVGFCGLIISGVLFFTDFERQKQNMMPMLWLIFLALIGAVVGFCIWQGHVRWAIIVMGALAVALLLACILALRGDFICEIQKRFHIK